MMNKLIQAFTDIAYADRVVTYTFSLNNVSAHNHLIFESFDIYEDRYIELYSLDDDIITIDMNGVERVESRENSIYTINMKNGAVINLTIGG